MGSLMMLNLKINYLIKFVMLVILMLYKFVME